MLSLLFIILQTEIQDIYKMPLPIKQDPDDPTDYRIPHPVPQPQTDFFMSVSIKQDPDDPTNYRIPHPVPQPQTDFFMSVSKIKTLMIPDITEPVNSRKVGPEEDLVNRQPRTDTLQLSFYIW